MSDTKRNDAANISTCRLCDCAPGVITSTAHNGPSMTSIMCTNPACYGCYVSRATKSEAIEDWNSAQVGLGWIDALAALREIMPFVEEDYMGEFATPVYKSAVEHARRVLQSGAGK